MKGTIGFNITRFGVCLYAKRQPLRERYRYKILVHVLVLEAVLKFNLPWKST
mgnify:CR=1 FL=1